MTAAQLAQRPLEFALPAARLGVLAVLDAADVAHQRLADAQWAASFAPPVTGGGSCVCGSTYEKRGSDQVEVTASEVVAAAEAVRELLGRGVGEFPERVVARVIDAINHERAVAEGDADRDWYDAHANCGDDL